MSSDSTTEPIKKKTRTISFTRGSAYILEGCLQELGPCTTPNKLVKWSKLWGKFREKNDRIIDVGGAESDFEKPFFKNDGESQESFTRRTQAHRDAFDVWKDEPFEIELSEKQYDIAREALKWVNDHQKDDKCRYKFAQSTHLGLVFEALGLSDDDSASADE